MPYVIRKVRNQDCYRVYNKETGKIHAKCSTRENATKQLRLLRAVDHGWSPSRSKSRSRLRSRY